MRHLQYSSSTTMVVLSTMVSVGAIELSLGICKQEVPQVMRSSGIDRYTLEALSSHALLPPVIGQTCLQHYAPWIFGCGEL